VDDKNFAWLSRKYSEHCLGVMTFMKWVEVKLWLNPETEYNIMLFQTLQPI